MEQESHNNASIDIQQIIREVFDRYTDNSYIKASMLPDLDLYVDQITTFLTQHLTRTTRNEDDKIMTKTMINNYTKNHLLPPPEKKKYSKDHILLLIFIYYFKNFLSISDIQTILAPLTEQYFHNGSEINLEYIYSTLFSKESTYRDNYYENILKEYEISGDIFAEAPKQDQQFLREFSFICILSLDIYIKKQLIETIIDHK
ncbi:MAG: DUF1836 domain-containing protein [Coprococcus sp.]